MSYTRKKKKVLIYSVTGFISRNIMESLTNSYEFDVYGIYLNSKPLVNLRIKMI